MKAAIVFVLLFAVVLCNPVKRSASSDSSEEVVKRVSVARRPAPARRLPELIKAVPVRKMAAAAATSSEESMDSSDETGSDTSSDSDDRTGTEPEVPTEAGPAPTSAPATTPEISTPPPPNNLSRGDYPKGYKNSIIYVPSSNYDKRPSTYKTYGADKNGFMSFSGKKTSLDNDQDVNEVEKQLQVYKALQVHEQLLEGDSSTPEVAPQGLDTANGDTVVEEPASRQAHEPGQEPENESEGASGSASDATSESASASPSEEEEAQSSEEVTATAGAADSDSQSSEEEDDDSAERVQDATGEPPVVITAK